MLSSGRSASASPRTRSRGGGKFAAGEIHARIGAVQFGRLLAARFFELHAEHFECTPKPGSAGPRTRSAQDRALQRRDRARGVALADSEQRMFEQREQLHRGEFAKRRLGGKPSEDASRRVRERIAGGILRALIPHRSSAAVTRRASARSGVTSAAVFSSSTASRSATAMASASSSAVAASIMVMVRQRRVGMRLEAGSGRALPPQIRRRRRPQYFRHQPLAARRLDEAFDSVAGDADAGKQGLQRVLGVSRRRRNALALIPGDQSPGVIVQIGVETGQHDGAVRQARDSRDQFRGGRNRAGGTRGDHGAVGLARKPRGFGLDQRVAAPRRFDETALVQDRRPVASREVQELQRELPVLIEEVGHEAVELFPRNVAHRHVVHEPREIVGKRASRGRRLGDERTSARAVDFRRVCPLAHQLRRATDAVRDRRAPAEDSTLPRQSRPIAASAKAISSSSISPMATMRGRMAASISSVSRKASRVSRQARRVGR